MLRGVPQRAASYRPYSSAARPSPAAARPMAQPRNVGRIRANETAFFICDVQERFRPLIQNYGSVMHVSNLLVRAGKILAIPVIATEQNSRALGKTVPEVSTEGVAVFEKMRFSMLIPEVEAKLKERNTKSVVLCGIEAHVCVLQTVLDLIEKDYEVHLLADGVSSTRIHDRIIGLERARQAGAWVTSSQSILFQLLGDAKHEKFKEISALVKETQPDPGISHL